MPKGKLICVKIYFDEREFAVVANLAEQAKKRPLGLKLKVLKPHGFADQYIANTKGIAKFLHWCVDYYKDTEADRAFTTAQLLARKKELEEEARKKGVTL